MTVPEYLTELADESCESSKDKMLREIAARWEKMEEALADAEAVAKGAWAEVNNHPSSHRRHDYEFYRDALTAARAPLGEEGKEDD